jgi:phosphoribosylformylglycinamidine cyclo-ligase
MYQVFNMGHRMEVICPPECAGEIIETAKGFGVDARVIGRTEASGREDGTNHLSLTHAGTTLEYAL